MRRGPSEVDSGPMKAAPPTPPGHSSSWAEVPLDELPRWSSWPARLLGLAEWVVPVRDSAKVLAEYDADKYARCLAYLEREPGSGPEDVKTFEFAAEMAPEICVSRRCRLLPLPLQAARELYYELLAETMADSIEASGSVVELGCGYGYNLWRLAQVHPGPVYRGGDYSANAVEIARRLYTDRRDLSVDQFDFYAAHYTLLEGLPEPVTVFTSHAVEQIPRAGGVVEAILKSAVRINGVFHFEPVLEEVDNSLLGMMRRRYTELNDYNRDLLSELRQRKAVRIRQVERDVLGLNPLNPTWVVHWEPN